MLTTKCVNMQKFDFKYIYMIVSATKNLALMVHNSLFMKKLPFWNIKSVHFVLLISSHITKVFVKGNYNWVAEI